MVNYDCPRCGYTTQNKPNIVRHLNRKKICLPIVNDIDLGEFKKNFIKKPSLKCQFCGKKCSRSDNLKRHEENCTKKG